MFANARDARKTDKSWNAKKLKNESAVVKTADFQVRRVLKMI